MALVSAKEKGSRRQLSKRSYIARQKRKFTTPVFSRGNQRLWAEILGWFKRCLPLRSARTTVPIVSFSVLSEGRRFKNTHIENLQADGDH